MQQQAAIGCKAGQGWDRPTGPGRFPSAPASSAALVQRCRGRACRPACRSVQGKEVNRRRRSGSRVSSCAAQVVSAARLHSSAPSEEGGGLSAEGRQPPHAVTSLLRLAEGMPELSALRLPPRPLSALRHAGGGHMEPIPGRPSAGGTEAGSPPATNSPPLRPQPPPTTEQAATHQRAPGCRRPWAWGRASWGRPPVRAVDGEHVTRAARSPPPMLIAHPPSSPSVHLCAMSTTPCLSIHHKAPTRSSSSSFSFSIRRISVSHRRDSSCRSGQGQEQERVGRQAEQQHSPCLASGPWQRPAPSAESAPAN